MIPELFSIDLETSFQLLMRLLLIDKILSPVNKPDFSAGKSFFNSPISLDSVSNPEIATIKKV